MKDIRLEAVIDPDKFEGDKEDAKDLILQFLEETDGDIQPKYTTTHGENGSISKELNGYDRKSEVWCTSIALLLISNPEGVIQFLRWASDVPGLTMGFTVEGNIRFKIFEKIDFTLIDSSTNYNIEMVGETEDHVLAKIPQEDWRHLYNDIHTEELDIELPPEDEIGP